MALKFGVRWRALCLAACVAALPTAWAGQVKYSSLYVFGDSLSDTGNVFIATSAPPSLVRIPPPSLYWQGRFSNGPVAAEYLWRLVARKNNAEVTPYLADPTLQTKPAVSFAFGGTTTEVTTPSPSDGSPVPALLGQVGIFTNTLAGRKAPDKALYMVWSGSNDYLNEVSTGVPGVPSTVVANVANAIRGLYAAGARDFLVPNLADLGITPFSDLRPGSGPRLTALSKAHNALLKTTLTSLERELRHSRIVEVDIFKLAGTLVSTGFFPADPPALEEVAQLRAGASVPPPVSASTCLFLAPAECSKYSVEPSFLLPYLFWDAMHPTTQVHGVLGTAMYGALLTQP